MSKNLPPVMGERVHDFLSKQREPGTICSRLIMSTNTDTCMADTQKYQLNESLGMLRRLYEERDTTGRFEFIESLERVTLMINSFRLDCNKCLNGECPSRDPQYPVTEVHKKAGHTPIGHKKTEKKK